MLNSLLLARLPPAERTDATVPYETRDGGGSVELNRNHYFMAGVVLLLIGIQLRMVDSYVLNESSTRFLSSQVASGGAKLIQPIALGTSVRKVVKPPEWLGWAMMSFGSVLVLHALAMKAPGAEH